MKRFLLKLAARLAPRWAWRMALISGAYEQGQGLLRSMNDRFCCLGVACDLYPEGHWTLLDEGYYQYGKCGGVLPSKVASYFGVAQQEQDKLIDMNDEFGKSFKEIAQAIKEQSA